MAKTLATVTVRVMTAARVRAVGWGGAVHVGEFVRASGGPQRDDDHECGGEEDDGDGHDRLPLHDEVLA
ncbi:hypothetical protein ACWEO4_42460 [Streptomyces sp. NPDC004393]